MSEAVEFTDGAAILIDYDDGLSFIFRIMLVFRITSRVESWNSAAGGLRACVAVCGVSSLRSVLTRFDDSIFRLIRLKKVVCKREDGAIHMASDNSVSQKKIRSSDVLKLFSSTCLRRDLEQTRRLSPPSILFVPDLRPLPPLWPLRSGSVNERFRFQKKITTNELVTKYQKVN